MQENFWGVILKTTSTLTNMVSGLTLKAGLVLGLSVFGLSACQDKPNAKSVQGVEAETLQTSEVARGVVARIINASGTVEPEITVLVGSEVSGRVTAVHVDFNTVVKAGDVLAEIDPQTFQNRVRQLEAQKESAEATVRVREASIQRTEVNLGQAKAILARREGLFAENAASKAQLEEAQRSVGVNTADIELGKAQLDAATAALKQVMASLKTARISLSRTTITSPIDGIVIERKIDPGQTVQASFSSPQLFEIAADLSEILVEASIVESDVAGLNEGDRVSFTVDAYPNTNMVGVIKQLRLNSQIKSNIVTYVAIVRAQNAQGVLLPGMTANLQITTDSKPDVLRIAASAERFRPNPAQITQWKAPDVGVQEKQTLNGAVYTRLARIGVPADRIASIRIQLEETSKPMRDIINDPTKSFMRTPMLQRLEEVRKLVLGDVMSPPEYQRYKDMLSQENAVRTASLWVQTAEGKMMQKQVKLGLSDGAFVEIVSGLEDGDKVVLDIKSGAPRGAPQGKRPQRPQG